MSGPWPGSASGAPDHRRSAEGTFLWSRVRQGPSCGGRRHMPEYFEGSGRADAHRDRRSAKSGGLVQGPRIQHQQQDGTVHRDALTGEGLCHEPCMDAHRWRRGDCSPAAALCASGAPSSAWRAVCKRGVKSSHSSQCSSCRWKWWRRWGRRLRVQVPTVACW